MDPLTIISPVISLVGGGLAGGPLSLYFSRRFYLRKIRTELYPRIETVTKLYAIRSLLPEGRGWIVDGKTYRPGPSDEEFLEKRKEFIAWLVEFNELDEARELRSKMVSGELARGSTDGISMTELEKESRALSQCFEVLRKKLGLR